MLRFVQAQDWPGAIVHCTKQQQDHDIMTHTAHKQKSEVEFFGFLAMLHVELALLGLTGESND